MVASRIFPGNKARVKIDESIGGVCYCLTTIDYIAATCITDMDYPEKAADILLNKLIMDFRDHFSDDPEIYENVTHDISLRYENIENFLKEW